MEKCAPSDILLTYFDITIRQRDLDCLQPHSWLNDICIAFYYQFLKEFYKKYGKNSIYFHNFFS